MYNNLFLSDKMEFTNKNGFPQLNPYNGPTDFEWIAYSERNKATGIKQAVHFFIDDSRFRYATWQRLEQTSYGLLKFDYHLTPDYSLWVDRPDFFNKESIFRSRFVGAYWQRTCGCQVIPTASWGNANSFDYCFEGLPEHSVIAVSGIGHRHCKAAQELWYYGIQELERQKSPSMILVYGGEESIPMLDTPVKFIDCYISKKFRK